MTKEMVMEHKIQVALLGLGTMGNGMARNLLKVGFPLAVYNRTRAKADPFRSLGAIVVESPREAAANADVVISMLADDDASEAAWLGAHGALAAMKAGTVAVECSTLSPEGIANLHAQCLRKGVELIEAPVTGTRPQAEQGQLIFLAAGEKQTLDGITPMLQCMSKEILHVGPVGCGAQLKLINNFLSAVQVASFAEALAWIECTGLDRTATLEFLKRAAPGSPIFTAMADRMTRRTYEVNFALHLMRKDLRYAQAAAAREGVDLTIARCVERLFETAQQQGRGDQDMSAVAEVVANRRDDRGE
jgi:3-hydroxyisobutyrate dehydrogenase